MNQVLLFCGVGLLLASAEDTAHTIRFGKDDAGKLPAGWKADRTGKGEGSIWKVQADDTAPSKTGHVLVQTAKSPKAMYNLCIAPGFSGKDVKVSVAFKARTGDIDQGGGLVWRWQDADNYYVARLNHLEGNYRLYKVVAGKRTQLDTKEDLPPKKGEWHTLEIRHVGQAITCYLDGTKQLEAKDDTLANAGAVGLWTKADAITAFDDLKISEVRK